MPYLLLFFITFLVTVWVVSFLDDIVRDAPLAASHVQAQQISNPQTPVPETPQETGYVVIYGADLGEWGGQGKYEVLFHIWSPRILYLTLIFSLLVMLPIAWVKVKRAEYQKEVKIELAKLRLEEAKLKPRAIVQNIHTPDGIKTPDGRSLKEETAKLFMKNITSVDLNDLAQIGIDDKQGKILLELLAARGIVTSPIAGIETEWVAEGGALIRDVSRALGLNG